jgi:hypothetical protein
MLYVIYNATTGITTTSTSTTTTSYKQYKN